MLGSLTHREIIVEAKDGVVDKGLGRRSMALKFY